MASGLEEFRSTYFDECAELLADLEEQFASIAAGDHAPERLHAAFRAVHSIKGGGGAFGFEALVRFTHAYESLLDRIRSGDLDLTEPVVALCVRANDLVADLVAAARTGVTVPAGHGATEEAQFLALSRGEPIGSAPAGMEGVAAADSGHASQDAFAAPPLTIEPGMWEIRFAPHPELYARANDPLLLLRELGTLGRLSVRPVLGKLPPLADFDPFGVYCSWEITLFAPEASEASIREVFEFVDGICDLVVGRVETLPAPSAAAAEIDATADRLVPDLSDLTGSVPPASADAAEGGHAGPAGAGLATARPTATRPGLSETPAEPEPDRKLQSIRVDLEKVDRVVNMVGELVITQSMLTQQMDETLRANYQDLVRGLEVLAQTTRGLQDSVMAIRAQPVRTVFARLPRLVRELARQTGKKIRLETEGEQTEIDKTVIEQLADPLVHMIRNSADHGIERPGVRIKAGKPEAGLIRVRAEQAGSNILVCVEDDGAGIQRDRVLHVARSRGLLAAGQQLSDEQVDNLIFSPGFSTSETVTDLSGRGVGLDVVLANLKKIGGTVHVRSWPGSGTRIVLRLPLTLAVLDVMLVDVAGNPYVIPLNSIVETIQCARADFARTPSGAQVLRVRGEYVKVIDLASRFGASVLAADEERFIVLCETDGAGRVALVVDDIVGQQQVVIKSLEENFEHIEGIAGGTILGDGRVALILDPQGLRADVPQRDAA